MHKSSLPFREVMLDYLLGQMPLALNESSSLPETETKIETVTYN